MSLNKAILEGNVGRDPEVKHLDDGKIKASFSLATTRSRKDKDGNRNSDWHKIITWGKTAELVEKYVKKGTQLTVVGEINYREFIDKEGVKKDITEIICPEIIFSGHRPSSSPNSQKSDQENSQNNPGSQIDDDLPF
jgi:single-strand DNA-binding protein